MAKLIFICGKLCGGKSAYAERLREERNAVVLSVDEIMLTIFGQYAGDKHDEYTARVKKYLFRKASEIIKAGVNVIIDSGLWTKAERAAARDFCAARNIECEIYYIDVSDEVRKRRVDKRNRAVLAGETEAYYVDDNLERKFESVFEMPAESEIDVWIK